MLTAYLANRRIQALQKEFTLDHSNGLPLQNIALSFHTSMKSSNGAISSYRLRFCSDVVQEGKNITSDTIQDKGFRDCFITTSDSDIRTALGASNCSAMRRLRKSIVDLENSLNGFHCEDERLPLFVLTFDEVSSLMNVDSQNVRYVALNRILSCISKGHRFWYLQLSTETRIHDLLLSGSALSDKLALRCLSSRGQSQPQIFPPFTEFTNDIADFHSHFKLRPWQESMSIFQNRMFMSGFGRPLWLAYENADQMAADKILGSSSSVFNTNDENQVFAVLSNRLCLDFDMSNPVTMALAQDAVNYYMRLVVSVDLSTGVMFRTPNEPILSYATMTHLCCQPFT